MFEGGMLSPPEGLSMCFNKEGICIGHLDMPVGEQHSTFEGSWKWFTRRLIQGYDVTVWVERVKTKEEEGERINEMRPACGSNQSPCPVLLEPGCSKLG